MLWYASRVNGALRPVTDTDRGRRGRQRRRPRQRRRRQASGGLQGGRAGIGCRGSLLLPLLRCRDQQRPPADAAAPAGGGGGERRAHERRLHGVGSLWVSGPVALSGARRSGPASAPGWQLGPPCRDAQAKRGSMEPPAGDLRGSRGDKSPTEAEAGGQAQGPRPGPPPARRRSSPRGLASKCSPATACSLSSVYRLMVQYAARCGATACGIQKQWAPAPPPGHRRAGLRSKSGPDVPHGCAAWAPWYCCACLLDVPLQEALVEVVADGVVDEAPLRLGLAPCLVPARWGGGAGGRAGGEVGGASHTANVGAACTRRVQPLATSAVPQQESSAQHSAAQRSAAQRRAAAAAGRSLEHDVVVPPPLEREAGVCGARGQAGVKAARRSSEGAGQDAGRPPVAVAAAALQAAAAAAAAAAGQARCTQARAPAAASFSCSSGLPRTSSACSAASAAAAASAALRAASSARSRLMRSSSASSSASSSCGSA